MYLNNVSVQKMLKNKISESDGCWILETDLTNDWAVRMGVWRTLVAAQWVVKYKTGTMERPEV
jgi:hypothetical protein